MNSLVTSNDYQVPGLDYRGNHSTAVKKKITAPNPESRTMFYQLIFIEIIKMKF